MKFNIDITIATPCGCMMTMNQFLYFLILTFVFISLAIGADVLDSTSSDMLTDQKLNEEETWFELTPTQQKYRNYMVIQNKQISDGYHSFHQMLLFEFLLV